MLPSVQKKSPVFQFVLSGSCHGEGYHWQELGSIFFAFFLQVLIHIDEIDSSWTSSSPDPTGPALSASLCLSRQERCFSLFDQLGDCHLGYFHYGPVSLVLGSPELDTGLQMKPCLHWVKCKEHLSLLTSDNLCNEAKNSAINLMITWSTWWLPGLLGSFLQLPSSPAYTGVWSCSSPSASLCTSNVRVCLKHLKAQLHAI